MAGRENSLNEGLSSPSITMGLSKLNPASLCSINKDVSDNECTMGAPQTSNHPRGRASTRGWHGDMFTYFCFFIPLDTDICWKQKRRRFAWEVKELDLSDREEFASAVVYLSVTGGKVFTTFLPTCKHVPTDFKKVRPGASGCTDMTCKSVQRFTYLLCKCSFSCGKRGETKKKTLHQSMENTLNGKYSVHCYITVRMNDSKCAGEDSVPLSGNEKQADELQSKSID